MSPIPSNDSVAIRHPGQVRVRRTRAGIQKEADYIELLLDSGSRPAKRRSSGMTKSANGDMVSKERWDGCWVKCAGVIYKLKIVIQIGITTSWRCRLSLHKGPINLLGRTGAYWGNSVPAAKSRSIGGKSLLGVILECVENFVIAGLLD